MYDTVLSTVNALSSDRLEPWRDLKETLLVGEGNLSFAKASCFCHVELHPWRLLLLKNHKTYQGKQKTTL